MKNLKLYESFYPSPNDSELKSEINLIEKIENFMKKHGLYEILVKRTGYLEDSWHFLVLSKNYNGVLMKIVDGSEEDVMFGIPRYQGVDVFTDILNNLESMTQEEIDIELAKQESKKYNL